MRKTAGSSGDIHCNRIGTIDRNRACDTADAGCSCNGIKRTVTAGRYVAVICAGKRYVDASRCRERAGLRTIRRMCHRNRFGVQGFGLIAG